MTHKTPLIPPSRRAGLFGLASSIALLAAMPAIGQTTPDCRLVDGVLPEACEQPNSDLVVETPVAPNQEQGDEGAPPRGFSITLDGETMAGEDRQKIAGVTSPAGVQRGQDIALGAADVQVRYDGIRDDRKLNVLTDDLRTEFRGGDTVTFRTSSNYARWIARAEIRIIPIRRGVARAATITVPVEPGGQTSWSMPAGEDEGDYTYVLRVYDQNGRFDETAPAVVSRRDRPVDPVLNGPVIAAGEGDDRTARRNIPLGGGTVTVTGGSLPANATVLVMGRPVLVDASGRFATEIVLPAGQQSVSVALSAPNAKGVTLNRLIDIPRNDWYATGLADLTFGRRGTSLSSAESFSSGRLAFYAKGVLAGNTRITASVDTGEEDLDNLFDDFLTKDPHSVLDRIDPDDLYPTYGDDSTIVDDAPTSGKAYLRVDEGENTFIWGDFDNRIENSAFLSYGRELYGAQTTLRSAESTLDGERRYSATLYAAEPDSLPQRDQLRGTGGSVYVLQRRDVVPGSETIKVEITDPLTGRVVETRALALSKDYRIDYFQGTVILTDPLTSSTDDGGTVVNGPTGDFDVNLVVQYEYVPVGGVLDGSAIGGRVEGWLPGDFIRLGITAADETTDTADLKVIAGDVHLRFSEGSFLEAEVAQSEGTGFGRSFSSDGGFTWVPIAGSGTTARAQAVRVEGNLDLADLAPGMAGALTAFYEDKDKGFSTLSEDVTADQTEWGLGFEVAVSDRLQVSLAYEDFDSDSGTKRRQGTADLSYKINPDLTIDLGLAHLDQNQPGEITETGKRTDLGFKLTRALADDQSIYVFGQGTLDRQGTIRRNDRLGFGGRFNLSPNVAVEAEASDGTNGFGGRALLDYRPDDTSRYYLGYELDPNRDIAGTTSNGTHQGTIIAGSERRVNDLVSYFTENNYDLFGRRQSLTSAYGVTYTPSTLWSYSANVETGLVRDQNDGDFDRTALGFGAKYDDGDGVNGNARLEYRIEDQRGTTNRDRETYAITGAYANQFSDDWRLVGSIDALVSASDQADFLDGRYIEARLGYAYRPVDNDRWNLLARYTFLYDLPGVDQVLSDGSTAGNRQRSHILSLDAIYQPTANWEFGGKLAYRLGETAPRDGGEFTQNDAALVALRATYNLEQVWEFSGEARVLVRPDADTTDAGALLTIYRSVGNNAKIGLGYNFGEFSDDLRDTTLDDRGVFLNLQAKF